MRPVLFNQDCTEFFMKTPAEKATGGAVDRFVDGLAAAGVGTLFSNTNAMRTNYESAAWEPFWHEYDAKSPDDQPALTGYPRDRIAQTRRMLDCMLALHERGIDFHLRAFARCRRHNISPWISLRMNDIHDVDLTNSPLLSTFWKEKPELRRGADRALDYSQPRVRDHYRSLIVETLQRYDLNGLELDFMRFPYHFRTGHELEGGEILTDWLRGIRRLTKGTARRLGHPVGLSVRVPSSPATARNLGLDAVRWAREGLIDLVVATPFWATTEFDMPMRLWRMLLPTPKVALAGGLEVRVQAYPGGPANMVTPETAVGAAVGVLSAGADLVYLFNYFADLHLGGLWTRDQYERVLSAMSSLDQLTRLPRRHAVTFRDTLAPGEPACKPLPAYGASATFRMRTGPRPTTGEVRLEIKLDTASDATAAPPRIWTNRIPCTLLHTHEGNSTYEVPIEALTEEYQIVEASSVDDKPMRIVQLELAIAGP